MADRDLQSIALAPFGGIDARAIDDRLIQNTVIRGGQNVYAVDGEWWCRTGVSRKSMPRKSGVSGLFVSPMWAYAIEVRDTEYDSPTYRAARYWVGLYGVLMENLSTGEMESAFDPFGGVTPITAAFTNGSQSFTYAGGIGSGLLRSSGGVVYGYIGTNPSYTLDRPWEGATGNDNVGYWSAASIGGFATGVSSVALFRHLPDYAAGSPVPNSPAVEGSKTYLVIAWAGGVEDPTAIDISDPPQAVIGDFLLDTSAGSGLQPAIRPLFVASHKERLVFAWLDFQSYVSASAVHPITWVYSAPLDLSLYSTGVTDQGATLNDSRFTDDADPITGLAVSGDVLTIHREKSQALVSFDAPGAADYTQRPNRQGVGVQVNDHRAIILAQNVQYLIANGGPAIWDGSTIRYMDSSISDLWRSFMVGSTITTSPEFTGHVGWHSPEQRMLGWFIKTSVNPDAATRDGIPWLVYDYDRNAWSMHVIPRANSTTYPTGASEKFLMMSDGSVVELPFPMSHHDALGTDWDPATGQDQSIDYVVQTQWMDFGLPTEKHLAFVDMVLRDSGYSGTTSLTVTVHADYNETAVQAETLEVAASEWPTPGGYGFASRVRKRVELRCQGHVFRFTFSASVPFRISNAFPWFRATGSRKAEKGDG